MDDEELSPLDYEYIIETPYNEEMYNLLWEGRGLSIEITQFREIKLWKRLVFIKLLEEKLQNLISNYEYDKGEAVLKILRKNVTNPKIIDSFDQASKYTEKYSFISILFKQRIVNQKHNEEFSKLIQELTVLLEEKDENQSTVYLENTEKKFNKYFEIMNIY